MGFFSKFEGKMEDTVEGVASSFGGSTLSPVQITKKAEREMRREKMVGAGVQYAPTLYTVLVSPDDDSRLFGYYPTLAGEVETYLMGKASELGLMMDGQPLVRFISDDQLKRGKFDVVAEMVSSPIISQLRAEEMKRYGIETPRSSGGPRNQVKPAVRGSVAGTPAGMARTYDQAHPVRLQPLNPSNQTVRPARMPRGQGYYAKNDPLYTSGSLGRAESAKQAEFARQSEPVRQVEPARQTELPNQTIMLGQQNPPAPQPGVDFPISEVGVYLYDEEHDKAFALNGKVQRIGRESSNDIKLPDINASRVHAEIGIDNSGRWIITDLGSTNGVYVNTRRVESIPLHDGDIILIGTTELEFQQLQ